MKPIFRIVYREEIKELVNYFAKVHQYDDRNDFKDAWKEWCEEHEDEIQNEVEYHQKNGNLHLDYETIVQKLFVSARYYHRKKSNKQASDEDKKERSERSERKTNNQQKDNRRKYIKLSNDVLDTMREHAEYDLEYGTGKPSDAYQEFCDENPKLVDEETERLRNTYTMSRMCAMSKIKKTYKNLYYGMRNKNA